MNLVDIIVLVLVVLAAIEGLRAGAVLQVLTYGSFGAGLYVGVLLASETVRWVHSELGRTIVLLVTMLGVAVIFGIVGRLVGARLFMRLHRGWFGPVDSVLGVAVAVAGTLLIVWLVASTVVTNTYSNVNASISGSRIIRAVDRVLPAPPSVFSHVQGFFRSEGFPQVFAQLVPATAGPVVPAGSGAVQETATAAGSSTVKIVGEGCGDIQEGSGFVVAPGVVVTNAHVVAGIAHPVVEDEAGTHQTTVVSFDPSFDLAVLRVSGLDDPPLTLDPDSVDRGQQAVVLGYPGGGPFTAVPAGVMAAFEAEGRNIYGQGLTLRDVYEIQAVVRPGNSGGPLIALDGQVIGVVFSRSTTNGDVGYALSSTGVLPGGGGRARHGRRGDRSVRRRMS